MKEYDEATLKRVQQIELGILKDFIKICTENNLSYFGLAGTGIGAIRHKGFIPWDDDIDVGLPRKDYEKFLQIAKQQYGDRYTVMNAEENENYPLMTTRWMLKGTEFREDSLKDIDCELGIFLDIYPFDNLFDDAKKRKRQTLAAWFWSKMLILRSIPHPVLGFTGAKEKLVRFACVTIHYSMRLFHISKKWLYQKGKKASMKCTEQTTEYLGYLCDTDPYSNTISSKELFPVLYMDFEDVQLAFPSGIDQVLRRMFGDYMQLPPVDKRKNHYPYRLDFGDK
ncbi:MAG: LicD family protein [Oscillospiraceae bacterium]|jgi:lipopolysaccharide cholinephosphotransferase